MTDEIRDGAIELLRRHDYGTEADALEEAATPDAPEPVALREGETPDVTAHAAANEAMVRKAERDLPEEALEAAGAGDRDE